MRWVPAEAVHADAFKTLLDANFVAHDYPDGWLPEGLEVYQGLEVGKPLTEEQKAELRVSNPTGEYRHHRGLV